MSTFQEFGPLSERRRAEKEQKRRKRIMIASGSISVIIIIAVVATVAVVFVNKNATTSSIKSNQNNNSNNNNKKDGSGPKQDPFNVVRTGEQIVNTICSRTDYKQTCITSLNNATTSSSKPKDVIMAAIAVINDKVGEAFNKSSLYKSDDPLTQGAVEVCNRLLVDSNTDLNNTLNKIKINNLEDLPKIGPELNVLLSAVRSYQETCVDSFPEGESKNKMKDAMKVVNELTSNALAIIRKVGSFLTGHDIPGINRRLLSIKKEERDVDEEGFPSWIGHSDRRVLKQDFVGNLKPNVTVAKDGSGQFTTINDALNAMPSEYDGRYVIYVKAGVYSEQVTITKKMVNITMFGDGSKFTVVTGSKSVRAGVPTYLTASFAVMGDGFMCIGMGFSNTAGPAGEQAVALRVQADFAIFLNCRMTGYQDTLYCQSKRQFYRGCIIIGTVDFIFGDSSAIFQNCILIVRRPGDGQQNIVTAHGRADIQETTGFVIHNSRIIASEDFVPVQANFKSYLARPWKPFSTTVIMESEIGDFIDPVGYLPWGDSTIGQDTCFYAEYNNRGPGAKTAQRANWKGVKRSLTKQAATQYTASEFLVDVTEWIAKPGVSVPFKTGFFN